MNFQVTYFFCPHSVEVVHSASNTNVYQGIFLQVKCGRDVDLTALPSICAACQSKDGSPTFHPLLSLNDLLRKSFKFYFLSAD